MLLDIINHSQNRHSPFGGRIIDITVEGILRRLYFRKKARVNALDVPQTLTQTYLIPSFTYRLSEKSDKFALSKLHVIQLDHILSLKYQALNK